MKPITEVRDLIDNCAENKAKILITIESYRYVLKPFKIRVTKALGSEKLNCSSKEDVLREFSVHIRTHCVPYVTVVQIVGHE